MAPSPTALFINGVTVHFPFTPYSIQRAYMSSVIEAARSGTHALLESPTGTGKTLSLLCALLALVNDPQASLRRDPTPQSPGAAEQAAPRSLRPPQIVYAARTHSQLSQVIAALPKAIQPQTVVKMGIAGSRSHLCCFDKALQLASKGSGSASRLTQVCTLARKAYSRPAATRESDAPSADAFSLNTLDGSAGEAGASLKNVPTCPYYAAFSARLGSVSSVEARFQHWLDAGKGSPYTAQCPPVPPGPLGGYGDDPDMSPADGTACGHSYVYDMEDLVAFGREETVCPYFLSRRLNGFEQKKDVIGENSRPDLLRASESASGLLGPNGESIIGPGPRRPDLLFLPYNYLLSPELFANLEVDLAGAIVVFDEAHNLESVCCDAFSAELTPLAVQALLDALVAALGDADTVTEAAEAAKAAKAAESAEAANAKVTVRANQVVVDISMKPAAVNRLTVLEEEAERFLRAVRRISREVVEVLARLASFIMFHTRTAPSSSGGGDNVKMVPAVDMFAAMDGSLALPAADEDLIAFEPSDRPLNYLRVHDALTALKRYLGFTQPTMSLAFMEPVEVFFSGISRMVHFFNPAQNSGRSRSDKDFADPAVFRQFLSTGSLVCAAYGGAYGGVYGRNGDAAGGAGAAGGFTAAFDAAAVLPSAPVASVSRQPRRRPDVHSKAQQAALQAAAASSAAEIRRSQQTQSVRHGSGAPAHLRLFCLTPALAFNIFLRQVRPRCAILTSGTLAPLSAFADDFGAPFPVRLENPHVVQPWQLYARVLSWGPGANGRTALNGSFKNRSSPDYQLALGRCIIAAAGNLHTGGVLVMFPSYRVMQDLSEAWAELGLFAAIQRQGKRAYTELTAAAAKKLKWAQAQAALSTSSTGAPAADPVAPAAPAPEEHVKVLDGLYAYSELLYMEACAAKGALLFAVTRGKLSEGIDFSGNLARVVVVVGLPYPNFKSLNVTFRRQYLDTLARISDPADPAGEPAMTGNKWYEAQMARALNQACGRVLRSAHDFGAILLADERVDWGHTKSLLSKWIRDALPEHATDASADIAGLRPWLAAAQDRVQQAGLDDGSYVPGAHRSGRGATAEVTPAIAQAADEIRNSNVALDLASEEHRARLHTVLQNRRRAHEAIQLEQQRELFAAIRNPPPLTPSPAAPQPVAAIDGLAAPPALNLNEVLSTSVQGRPNAAALTLLGFSVPGPNDEFDHALATAELEADAISSAPAPVRALPAADFDRRTDQRFLGPQTLSKGRQLSSDASTARQASLLFPSAPLASSLTRGAPSSSLPSVNGRDVLPHVGRHSHGTPAKGASRSAAAASVQPRASDDRAETASSLLAEAAACLGASRFSALKDQLARIHTARSRPDARTEVPRLAVEVGRVIAQLFAAGRPVDPSAGPAALLETKKWTGARRLELARRLATFLPKACKSEYAAFLVSIEPSFRDLL
jgi:Rad3-related DNA helicase